VPEARHQARANWEAPERQPQWVSTSRQISKSVCAPAYKEIGQHHARHQGQRGGLRGAEIMREEARLLGMGYFVKRKMRFFRDDASFKFWIPKTKQVHFRSASRAGKSDMGLNGKRYERLDRAL